MNALFTQAPPRNLDFPCDPRRHFRVGGLRSIAVLAAAATLTGCAAMDPGNWQVVGPPSSYVRPAPAIVTPAPMIVQPAPVIVTPAPAIVAPAPVIIGPRPSIAPIIIAPMQPRTSRDAAHFLRERCYLEKGGCYTSESQQGYEFNPYTGTWDWVNQTDYHWKHRRRR